MHLALIGGAVKIVPLNEAPSGKPDKLGGNRRFSGSCDSHKDYDHECV
jgi:hypothetical protein